MSRIRFWSSGSILTQINIIVTSGNQILRSNVFSCWCWPFVAYLISHTLMPSTVPGGEVELSYSAFFKQKCIGFHSRQCWILSEMELADTSPQRLRHYFFFIVVNINRSLTETWSKAFIVQTCLVCEAKWSPAIEFPAIQRLFKTHKRALELPSVNNRVIY